MSYYKILSLFFFFPVKLNTFQSVSKLQVSFPISITTIFILTEKKKKMSAIVKYKRPICLLFVLADYIFP